MSGLGGLGPMAESSEWLRFTGKGQGAEKRGVADGATGAALNPDL
jgi:hypothetical protein